MFETLAALALLAFVLSSMIAMGLRLTLAEIARPLTTPRLPAAALFVNFVVAPAVVVALWRALPEDDPMRPALALLAFAAGAPFLPKLGEIAKGSNALSVAMMALLMGASVVVMPIAAPWLLGSVNVTPWDVAQSLVLLMLLPLCAGLAFRAWKPGAAARVLPVFAIGANVALLALIVLATIANSDMMIALFGSTAMLAALAFVAAMLVAGFALGGRGLKQRSVLALAAGQRNISAALIVANRNFDLDVVTALLVVSGSGFLLLMGSAIVLGRITARREAN